MLPTIPSRRASGRLHSLRIDPSQDLVGVEAHELADLHEGDPAFAHQPADEDDLDPEPLRHSLDVEEAWTMIVSSSPLRSRTDGGRARSSDHRIGNPTAMRAASTNSA